MNGDNNPHFLFRDPNDKINDELIISVTKAKLNRYIYMSDKNAESDARVLMELAKKGDTGAFGRLYELYFTPVYRYIYFRVRDRREAEDLIQIVFLKAYKSVSSFRDIGR